MQAKISRRRKGEEEANNLLVSYFENPKFAPTFKIKEEIKKEEIKKEEMKKEEVKEETEDIKESKSIWSNFSEVLKRPPREKIQAPAPIEIETKEENDGPKSFTMFDLIKSRTYGN